MACRRTFSSGAGSSGAGAGKAAPATNLERIRGVPEAASSKGSGSLKGAVRGAGAAVYRTLPGQVSAPYSVVDASAAALYMHGVPCGQKMHGVSLLHGLSDSWSAR